MLKTEWRYHFENDVIQRGYDSFYHGHVKCLERNQKDCCFVVADNQKAHVWMSFSHGHLHQIKCDCEAAKKGTGCSHMAASLIYLENSELPLNIQFMDVKQIMHELTPQMKDDLLEAALKENYALLEKANQFFWQTLSDYESESLYLNHLFMMYGYQQDAPVFEKNLLMFIDDAVAFHLHSGEYEKAFGHLKHLLSRLKIVMAEDNLFQVEIAGLNMLAELLKQANCLTDKIFAFICSDLKRDTYLDFLFDYFRTPPYLEKKKQIIIQFIKKTDAFEAWAKDYYLENYVLKLMQVLYDAKEEAALKTVSEKYQHFVKVREFWIEEAIARKDYTRAIELLETSKEIDRRNSALILKYEHQLTDLYELSGDERYFDSLKKLLFELDAGDFDDYLRFKNLCSQKQWQTYRKQLLQMPMKQERLLEILLAEKMYEEALHRAVLQKNLRFLYKYESILLDQCGRHLTEGYVQILISLAEMKTDVKNQQEIEELFLRIQRLPDGISIFDKVFSELSQTVGNNHRLIDRLSCLRADITRYSV